MGAHAADKVMARVHTFDTKLRNAPLFVVMVVIFRVRTMGTIVWRHENETTLPIGSRSSVMLSQSQKLEVAQVFTLRQNQTLTSRFAV